MKIEDIFPIKGFTLAEMLISMTIIMIVMAITIPPVLKRGAGNEVNSNACVIKKLASSVTLPMTETVFNAMSDSDPCKKAVNFCQYNQNKACNSLIQLSNYGKMNPDERTAARKVLRAACDLGGKEACKYFVDSCKKDSSVCNRVDDNDIHYYLSLLPGVANSGLLDIQDYIGYLYGNNITNIKNEVDNACCKPSYTYACLIKGIDVCPIAKKMGGADTDSAWSITADSTGIYIAGTEYSEVYSSTSYDIFVMKLDIDTGATIWKKRFGGSSGDSSNAIAIDSTGVYITGFQSSDPVISSASSDTYAIKISKSDGTTIWKKKIGGSQSETGRDIAVDYSGVYITGSELSDTINGTVNSDIYVMNLNSSNGSVIWKKKYGGTDSDSGYSLALDGGSSIYLTGQTYSDTVTGTSNPDIFAMQINKSDGTVGWKKKFGGTGNEYGMAITVDISGVYLLCKTPSDPVLTDSISVIKLYKNTGNVIWKKKFGRDSLAVSDIVAGNDGVYVLSGYYGSGSLGNDFFVLKLRPDNGSVIWKRLFGGSDSDYGRGIALYNNSLYITGTQKSDPAIPGPTNFDDIYAIRISSAKQTNNLSTYFDGYDLNTYFNAYDITYTGFNGADIGGTYFNGYDMNTLFSGTNITSTYFNASDIDQTKFSL